jgi:Holliday junction resolvase-like predicted endonuclease
MKNFQSQSKKSGDAFEELVHADLVNRGFVNIDRNYCFEDAGCEVDFRAHSNNGFEYVEAKGGNSGEGKRPGAQRTDNVKKAIANGALIKTYNTLYYVVYFSAKPDPGSYSDKMINLALKNKIIDEVRYLEPTNDFKQYWLDFDSYE